MEDQEAENVAKYFVKNIILAGTGIPQKLVTDQGSNFESKFFKSVCKLLEVEKIRTSPYHPQTNMVERSHRDLGAFLRHYINPSQTNWDDLAYFAMFCHNTTEHSSTGFTPHFLMYGREPEIPNNILKSSRLSYNYDSFLVQLKQGLHDAYKIARQNMKKSKQTAKTYYDKNTKIKNFKVGDSVWLKNEAVRRGRSAKLSPKWLGPYKVIERIGDVNYRIKMGRGEHVIHANRLKYHLDL